MKASGALSKPLFPFAIYFLTTLAGSTAACSAAETAFTHPGVLHSRAELDFVGAKAAEGEEPWKSAWEELRSHDISELGWKPNPVANVVRGVRNHPDIGGTNLMQDGAAAYSHAIQWCVTGEQPHADKAIEILNAYATTLKSIGGHDAKLLAGMAGITFANAAEILRHTQAGWSAPDQEKFERLLRDVFYHHYHDRVGLEMPFTAQVIEKIRPERWRSSHASWGTLMHAGQPAH